MGRGRYQNEWHRRLPAAREHHQKAGGQSEQAVKTMKKRMLGYHRFEFFRSGWFNAGIPFLPLLLLLAWAVIGILHMFGLL